MNDMLINLFPNIDNNKNINNNNGFSNNNNLKEEQRTVLLDLDLSKNNIVNVRSENIDFSRMTQRNIYGHYEDSGLLVLNSTVETMHFINQSTISRLLIDGVSGRSNVFIKNSTISNLENLFEGKISAAYRSNQWIPKIIFSGYNSFLENSNITLHNVNLLFDSTSFLFVNRSNIILNGTRNFEYTLAGGTSNITNTIINCINTSNLSFKNQSTFNLYNISINCALTISKNSTIYFSTNVNNQNTTSNLNNYIINMKNTILNSNNNNNITKNNSTEPPSNSNSTNIDSSDNSNNNNNSTNIDSSDNSNNSTISSSDNESNGTNTDSGDNSSYSSTVPPGLNDGSNSTSSGNGSDGYIDISKTYNSTQNFIHTIKLEGTIVSEDRYQPILVQDMYLSKTSVLSFTLDTPGYGNEMVLSNGTVVLNGTLALNLLRLPLYFTPIVLIRGSNIKGSFERVSITVGNEIPIETTNIGYNLVYNIKF
ncbi:hypothetical protein DICPUDRAFT_81359 [Dictyostelium purpureum]|uniref:Uncharacterized protein n=1 Tax=Dictyostelium purpureum TaxID=5786 RepID=F0ZT89_DICPU|nr:uncharacterized protein DICPUDRAFT_81359 [Dictyostelium purpureum]EGC32851.1 hypothetical protein DICPUDRAFT_81359 [Dictyostelium purpureum]|eukprot:XP_003290636.1 hypothetical protein DICPUDRAFT_81359 [Dictyostelium purpureum]